MYQSGIIDTWQAKINANQSLPEHHEIFVIGDELVALVTNREKNLCQNLHKRRRCLGYQQRKKSMPKSS